jgi:uncharacterized tellurite resistance protein B-like protein
MKPRDFIQLLDDPTASPTIERSERSELLLTMLAHLFFADRRLDDGEVTLLKRLLPAETDVQGYIEELAAAKLDIARLGELFPDARDRDDIITLAEHAVWGDNEVDAREWDLVDKLVEQLGVERE